METETFKEKILAGVYYLGPLGIIAFLKPSSDFEKFHAVQGLSLFCFFILLILWAIFSLWIVPVLAIISLLGLLAIVFWLGFALYIVSKGEKLGLPGLEFLITPLKQYLVEEI